MENQKRRLLPNSRKNLKPFEPGNKMGTGRSKKLPTTDRYREHCEEALPDIICKAAGPEVRSKWGDLLARQVLRHALFKGSSIAAKEICEAVEGKTPQRIEVTAPENAPVLRVVIERIGWGPDEPE